jgi:hypothetical protein
MRPNSPSGSRAVKTKFKVEPGDGPHPEDRWYAWINDQWVPVPPDKIVPDYAPDGTPYLFVMAGTIQCFVRPQGGDCRPFLHAFERLRTLA